MKSHELAVARVSRPRNRGHDVLSAIADRYHGARTVKDHHPDEFAEDGADAVTLREVHDFPVPSEARLRALFHLTGAEAKLAQHLACGDSVEEVARKLSIKMTTARTQLASIFAKTDTRRQAKLVAILSRIAHLE